MTCAMKNGTPSRLLGVRVSLLVLCVGRRRLQRRGSVVGVWGVWGVEWIGGCGLWSGWLGVWCVGACRVGAC